MPESLTTAFIQQDWDAYSESQHAVWETLYARRMPALRHTASRVFPEEAAAIGLDPTFIPVLGTLKRRLVARAAWSAGPGEGCLPAGEFYQCLARRRFRSTVSSRPADGLDYVRGPDILHDVFGHVPLHADPVVADFLQPFGGLAAAGAIPE